MTAPRLVRLLLLGWLLAMLAPGAAQAQGSAYANEMAAGRQAFEGSSFALAERHFQGAIDVAASDTQKATAWYSLGVVAQKQGRTDDARQRAERAIALAPNHGQAKALIEELARTPVKNAKAKAGPVTGSTARVPAAEPAAKSAAAAAPAAPAPKEARRKGAANPLAEERQQAFESGDCDKVKTLDGQLKGEARHAACLEASRSAAIARGECEKVAALDTEIGGEAAHGSCLLEVEKLKAQAAHKARLDQRTAALGELACDRVKALDGEIGTDPQHEGCVVAETARKAADEREALTARRTAAFLSLNCDEVLTLDGRLGDESLHKACALNTTLRSGSPRELFLAGTRRATDTPRDLDTAKLLFSAIVDRHPSEELAIKAAEQLVAIANAEAIGASNAEAVKAATRVERLIERASAEAAERATAPTREFCATRPACARTCPARGSEGAERCREACTAKFARCS